MKKRYIWGGAALWVLGSGLIILHMAQGDVEGKIRQWMAVHSCTAEEVDFSLLSDELSIRGITLEYEKTGENSRGRWIPCCCQEYTGRPLMPIMAI